MRNHLLIVGITTSLRTMRTRPDHRQAVFIIMPLRDGFVAAQLVAQIAREHSHIPAFGAHHLRLSISDDLGTSNIVRREEIADDQQTSAQELLWVDDGFALHFPLRRSIACRRVRSTTASHYDRIRNDERPIDNALFVPDDLNPR